MNKVLVAVLISLSIISVTIFITDIMEDSQMEKKENTYQGPVPQGYDENHFRKTGETILLVGGVE